MGVHDLWRILEPSCDVISLERLTGKTIAIDLSGWAVDSQCIESSRPGAPPNLNLRNLFHRTSALLAQGIQPVFVIEGKPPELKNKVINERINGKNANSNAQKKGPPTQRLRLNAILRQCERLLNLMGLTCIQADGEAEATCSYLNADGLVDGVISQDNDCFLYGAKIVYRDFKITSQSSDEKRTVKEYSMEKIEERYKLGREKMIAFALLCGCDYTDGVPHVGKVMAMKFLDICRNNEVLRIMRRWQWDNRPETTKEAEAVRKKCQLMDDFPNEAVIDEYMSRKWKVPTKIQQWTCPDGPELIQYLIEILNWTAKEAFDRVFPLMTRWQVFHCENLPHTSSKSQIVPIEIIKNRVQRGIPSFEIQWAIPNDEHYALILALMDEPAELTTYNTIEPQESVRKAYPTLVQSFEDLKNKSKKKTTTKAKNNAKDSEKTAKNAKMLNKRKEEPVKIRRIDEYFQERKIKTSCAAKMPGKKKAIENGPIPQKREKIAPELDDSIRRLFDDLSPEDFDANIDADSADMSLIVEKTCSETEIFMKIAKKETSQSPPSSSNEQTKKAPKSSSSLSNEPPKHPEIIDLSYDDDDDLIYIPLSQRIKSNV